MSCNRHPTRDSALRDAFNQLREQRGVSLDQFAMTLNGLVHGMCPAKAPDQPCLTSFTSLTPECIRAMSSWRKRVERWTQGPNEGGTEMPAWLEEPWCAALEELGDEQTRLELVRRHGYIGVRRPAAQFTTACAFQSLGAVAHSTGEAMSTIAGMLADGVLDENDMPEAGPALDSLDNAIAALMGIRGLIEEKTRAEEPTLQLAQ